MVNFPIHQYAKGQTIFEEGTIGQVAYILKTGSVEISLGSIEGKLTLATLKPGAIFGEMALLLKENKRTATAVALEDSEVVAIYKNYFFEYLNQSPVVINNLLSGLIERLQETTTRLLKANRLMFEIEEVLHLLVKHGVNLIQYDEVVQTMSRCSEVEVKEIKSQLDHLEKLGHIQITQDEKRKNVISLPYRKL